MGQTKQKLRNKETTHGAWVTILHPTVVEILQTLDFDWLVLDMEHAPFDNRTIYEMIRAGNGLCDILVRLPGCDADIAKQVLDAGADGIVVPNILTSQMARKVKQMAKYPPEGTRSVAICRANQYGNDLETYYAKHNDNVIIVIMVEDKTILPAIPALVRESDADVVLIGPYDLSASMGIPGQFSNPELRTAIARIREITEPECAPGIPIASADAWLATEYREEGFRFIACGQDTELLKFGARVAMPAQ